MLRRVSRSWRKPARRHKLRSLRWRMRATRNRGREASAKNRKVARTARQQRVEATTTRGSRAEARDRMVIGLHRRRPEPRTEEVVVKRRGARSWMQARRSPRRCSRNQGRRARPTKRKGRRCHRGDLILPGIVIHSEMLQMTIPGLQIAGVSSTALECRKATKDLFRSTSAA